MFKKADFPDCFPDNFIDKLNELKVDVEKDEQDVYRIGKNGENNRQAFKSTYEEFLDGEITDKDFDKEDILINFSTSCNRKKARIKGILKLCLKRHPRAVMLRGKTVLKCGPSQLTKKRVPARRNDGHIDWWLYKDSKPQDYFQISEEG